MDRPTSSQPMPPARGPVRKRGASAPRAQAPRGPEAQAPRSAPPVASTRARSEKRADRVREGRWKRNQGVRKTTEAGMAQGTQRRRRKEDKSAQRVRQKQETAEHDSRSQSKKERPTGDERVTRGAEASQTSTAKVEKASPGQQDRKQQPRGPVRLASLKPTTPSSGRPPRVRGRRAPSRAARRRALSEVMGPAARSGERESVQSVTGERGERRWPSCGGEGIPRSSRCRPAAVEGGDLAPRPRARRVCPGGRSRDQLGDPVAHLSAKCGVAGARESAHVLDGEPRAPRRWGSRIRS